MINFFRKLRHNQIEENKTGKSKLPAINYIKYALGEIILVMIGILLALQVNNWNEHRKEQQQELIILTEIKENLKSTLLNFQLDTSFNKKTIRHYRLINHYIKNDLQYSTELDSAFASIGLFSSPFTTKTGYSTLQNKGLDLIKNKALKEKIVRMYEVESISLLVDVDNAEWSLNDNIVLPFYSKHISRLDDSSLFIARTNDFESLKKNIEFKNILSLLIRERRKGVDYYSQTMLSITE